MTPTELETGRPDPDAARPTLPPAPAPEQAAQGGAARLNVRVHPRFKVGQRVRVRNMHPAGHTRLPRYARGKRGTVVRDHGVFALQDTDVNGDPIGAKPQHVFTIRFAARELWGDLAAPRDSVHIDLWEDYLERL